MAERLGVPDPWAESRSEERAVHGRRMKVVVYQGDDGFWYWHLKAENGEIISDSAVGYRHKGYAIRMAQKLNPNPGLVMDEAPGV
jgi:uncharacterized protein YegP (UPF0339 family)